MATDAIFRTVIVILYFVPWIIAAARSHRNTVPIALTNLFFGWTVLGWLITLIWAASDNVEQPNEQ